MLIRIATVAATVILAALLTCGCKTVQAGGEFAVPVWHPQINDATFTTDGRGASVSVDWRTGQAPFTVDVEMPGDFLQVLPITTSARSVSLSGLGFLIPEGTNGTHTYTVTFRIRDALGQVAEKGVSNEFTFPALP